MSAARRRVHRPHTRRALLTALVLLSALLEVGLVAGLVISNIAQQQRAKALAQPSVVQCSYSQPGGATRGPLATLATGSVRATIESSLGTVTVTMNRSDAPCAVRRFASLAAKAYYPHTVCRPVVLARTDALECGLSRASSTRGPVESVPAENGEPARYAPGLVAMPNAAAAGAHTGRFLIFVSATGAVPPGYTVIGTVSSGMVVVARAATAPSGPAAPGTPTVIKSVTVSTVSTSALITLPRLALVVLAILIVAAAVRLRHGVRWRRWRAPATALLSGLLVLLLVWAVAADEVILNPTTDLPAHADAIVVLGPASADGRIDEALKLADLGFAPNLLISTPGALNPSLRATCATRIAAVTVTCFAPQPATTQGEAREIRAQAAAHGWHTVLVVTSQYHISRARLIITRCFSGRVLMINARPPSWGEWISQLSYQTAAFAKVLLGSGC